MAVDHVQGAIGYAEAAVTADDEASKYPNLTEVQLDGRDASPEVVNAGRHPYPFCR